VVTPVTTRTIGLRAGNLPVGLALSARLFAGDGSASSTIALTRSGSDYIGTFNLTNPATEGHVRVWAAADNQKEAVTDFAMGGNPAGMRAGFAGMRAGFAGMRAGFAPSTSADGQVILYTTSLTFPEGQFYTLQAASKLPTPPAWLAPVGQAYWLQRSSGAPDLNGTSLAMGYLPREVPQGEERWLRIYRWTAVNGWQALTTTVVEDQNNAIAVIPGEGLYALFSTVEIPLYGPGWDIFAYTVQTSRPVAEALLSIDGKYNTVYWFNGADPVDPWKVYATGVPGWVIDLSVLQFGEAYWINLTESVTLRLKTGMSAPLTAPSGYPAPPATYYGLVKPGATFIPQAGMPVTAWVNDLLCGQGIVQSQAGKLVYTLNVAADALNTPGCGAPGQLVSFKVGSQQYSTVLWNNDQIWQVDIQPVVQVFLPLVIK